MQPRFFSFLTAIENSLVADEPSPGGGSWSVERTVNHHLGLARMRISSHSAARGAKALGEVVAQLYTLADGSFCLKSALSYAGSVEPRSHSSFPRTEEDWDSEARRVASEWLAGYRTAAVADDAVSTLAAAS